MLTVEQARKHFKKTQLTDKEIEELTKQLYALFNRILDSNLEKISKCKKP